MGPYVFVTWTWKSPPGRAAISGDAVGLIPDAAQGKQRAAAAAEQCPGGAKGRHAPVQSMRPGANVSAAGCKRLCSNRPTLSTSPAARADRSAVPSVGVSGTFTRRYTSAVGHPKLG